MGEPDITKVFLKTLGSFYYDRMVASAPSDFTKMVSMGVRLEEFVREGRLTKDEGINKSSYGFSRKKESEINVVAEEKSLDYQEYVISTKNKLLP